MKIQKTLTTPCIITLLIKYLVLMLISLVLLIALNKFKVTNFIPYLIIGIFLWDFTHQSGIHATIAGVLLALTIPHNIKANKRYHFVNIWWWSRIPCYEKHYI